MKIKLPNGAVIRVKEGFTPQQAANDYMRDYKARNAANIAKEQESYDPTIGMGTGERLRAGVGRGLSHLARGAANVTGLMSDEDYNAARELDKPLMDTTEGAIGDFIGQTAATAPVTMGVGALAGAAGRALPLATRGAATLVPMLRGVLPNALGGAVGGALSAGPGDRGSAAALGAGIGGLTTGLVNALGKAGTGLASRSDEFIQFRDQYAPGLHIPLGRSAKPGWIRKVYGALADTLGSSPAIQAQEEAGQAVVRRIAGEVGAPHVAIQALKNAGRAIPDINDNPQVWSDTIEEGINLIRRKVTDKAISLKGQAFDREVGAVLRSIKDPQVATRFRRLLGDVVRSNSGAKVIRGDTLVDLYTELKALRNSFGGTAGFRGQQVQKLMDSIKGMTTKYRHPSMGKPDDWKDMWQLVDDEWGEWAVTRGAIADAKSQFGKFTPRNLVANIQGSDSTIAGNQAPMQRFATLAEQAVGENPGGILGGYKTTIGTGLPLGSVGATAWLAGGPAAAKLAGLGYGALKLAGTEKFQRALVGELGGQKALAEAIRKNPQLLQQIAAGLTAAEIPEN